MPWREPVCEKCGGKLISMLSSTECADRCDEPGDFDEERTKPDGLAGLRRAIWNGPPSFPPNIPDPGDPCIHGVLYRSLESGEVFCWDCGDRRPQ